MKRLAVILAGSTLAMSGYAANWLEVSKSQTGSVFSLDVDSIERSDIHIIDEKPSGRNVSSRFSLLVRRVSGRYLPVSEEVYENKLKGRISCENYYNII